LTRADVDAIRDYLNTLPPVKNPRPDNQLAWPLDNRVLMRGWNWTFFDEGTFVPDPGKSAEWNRGAYLVEGLAHCGACHTPRNALGAERTTASFSGGDVDNWRAYAINEQSPAPVPWDADALESYLRNGFHPDHGSARGPMAEVVSNLSSVPPSDVRAIAVYMADVFGVPSPVRKLQGETVLAQAKQDAASPPESEGAKIYAGACAGCHDSGRPLPYGGIHLGLSTAVSAPDPRNLANIVLSGVRPIEGERSPIMPGFAAVLTDREAAALLGYLRLRFGRQPAWSDLENTVAEARRTQTAFIQNSAGPNNAPADPAQRDKP